MPADSVLELLKRLKALAEDEGAFAAEREKAVYHLSRLLAKHQLTMFDVEKATYREAVTVEDHISDQSAPKGHWWSLIRDISKAHDCRIVYRRRPLGPGGAMRVIVSWIGHESDVAVGSYVFGYCWQYLQKAADVAADGEGVEGYRRREWRAQFITAAGHELRRRIVEERGDVEAEVRGVALAPSDARGLVHVKSAAVDLAVAERFPSLKAGTEAKSYYGGGSEAGAAEGRRMPLRKGIKGGASAPRIGGPHGQA